MTLFRVKDGTSGQWVSERSLGLGASPEPRGAGAASAPLGGLRLNRGRRLGSGDLGGREQGGRGEGTEGSPSLRWTPHLLTHTDPSLRCHCLRPPRRLTPNTQVNTARGQSPHPHPGQGSEPLGSRGKAWAPPSGRSGLVQAGPVTPQVH